MATYEELKAQLDALNKEAEAAKAREISTALSQIRETVLRYEIRPDQIFPQW
ncbi:H-NS family nucleoid-associated regulatory protein, partial [Burkholderia pseudomallei]